MVLKEKIFRVDQLGSSDNDYEKINNIFFELRIQDLRSHEAGAKIINLLNNLKKQNINFIVINSLPRCIFNPLDRMQAIQMGVFKSCFDCEKLFRVTGFNLVKFCNGEMGKLIDEYTDRNDLYTDFIKSYKRCKIPEVCKGCSQRYNCSYGCICRNKEKISSHAKDALIGYSLKRSIKFLDGVNKETYRSKRIFCFSTYTCNNDCLYCFIGNKTKRKNPTVDFLKNMIKQNSKEFPWINFGGGEPTIYKHIAELIKFSKDQGLRVQMFSNGRRFSDKKFAKSVLDSGIDFITEVFHSFKPEIHDFITQRKGSFKQMLKGIDNLHSLGFHNLHFMYIVHKQNYRDLRKMMDFFLSFKPAKISFENLVFTGNAVKNFDNLAVKLTEISPYLMEAFNLLIEKNIYFRTSSFPLCLFGTKYWRYFNNLRYSCSSTNFPFDDSMDDYIVKTDGQSLTSKCIDCQLKKYCPGTWATYYSFFGDDELIPQVWDAERALYIKPREILKSLSSNRLHYIKITESH
jgi:MoaA/NifB/PqqE/SkfB family radical SAM enzyme